MEMRMCLANHIMNKACLLLIFSIQLSTYHTSVYNQEKPLVVVIPSYNNAKWYKKNLGSLFSQQYQNYRIIYVDDCSTDGTGDLVENYIKQCGQEHRTILIRNNKNKGSLENLYNAVNTCQDDEIIINLDADDWLYHNNVLQRINEEYQDQQVWITYGNYIICTKKGYRFFRRCCFPITPEIFTKSRTALEKNLKACHLKTFYVWLFKKINPEDLKCNDQFLKSCYDLAIMAPMLEMAREHHRFISDILYVYNRKNSLNVSKTINIKEMKFYSDFVRKKPKYMPL